MIVIGSGLAPPVIGLLSDLLANAQGGASLAWAMMAPMVAVALSSVIFFRAAAIAARAPASPIPRGTVASSV
jgi:hypothetical protein